MLKEANVPAPRFLLSVPGLIQRTPCMNYREHEREKRNVSEGSIMCWENGRKGKNHHDVKGKRKEKGGLTRAKGIRVLGKSNTSGRACQNSPSL